MSLPPGTAPGTGAAAPSAPAARPAAGVRSVELSADDVAAAVLACPLVVSLSGGRLGEVATYLPGRRVTGVRIGEAGITVHVVAAYGPTCAQVAAQVRQALQTVAGGLPVTVGIDDLDLDRRIISL